MDLPQIAFNTRGKIVKELGNFFKNKNEIKGLSYIC